MLSLWVETPRPPAVLHNPRGNYTDTVCPGIGLDALTRAGRRISKDLVDLSLPGRRSMGSIRESTQRDIRWRPKVERVE